MYELFSLSPEFQNLTIYHWLLAGFGAMGIGIAKGGIKGSGIFFFTLLALVFGAKRSTGLVVPLLIVADIFAVLYYKRHTDWKLLFRILPWIIAGILIGVLIGKDLPENIFKNGMGVIIFVSIFLMFLSEFRQSSNVPNKRWFSGTIGLLAGITTMIGNLAGAFTNIYFLAMRISKNQLIGSISMLYLIINLIKLPFHIFVWKTVTLETFAVNIRLIPAVILGIGVGILLVKVINERAFRIMILALTAIGAVLIFVR